MWRVAVLIALVVLTGCGGAPTKVETPPPAAQAPSQTQSPSPAQTPAPEPAPAPTPAAPKVDLCDQKLPLAERQKALPTAVIDLLKNGTPLGDCLRVDKIEGQNAVLVSGGWEKEGILAGVGWADPKGGVHAGTIKPPKGGWSVADALGFVGLPTFPEGRLSLLLMEITSGTGGYKRLVHVTEDQNGTLVTTALTDVHEKAWFQFIAPDLVLLNFRGNPGPQAWECNACMTANNQILWRWDGRQLTKVGERQWSEPYLTVNLMLGALRTGDTKGAARYATDPALVEQASKLLGPDVMAAPAGFWNEAYGKVQDAERTNWDLLPAGARTTVPGTKYDITVTKGSQNFVFHTTRTDKGWLVSGIN